MQTKLVTYKPTDTDISLIDLKYIIERRLGVDIHAKTRKRHIVDARRIFFYLARRHTSFSLSVLGGYFNLDHATALHAVRTAMDLIKTDAYFREILTNLEEHVINRKSNNNKKEEITEQPRPIHPYIRYAQKSVRKILIQRRQIAKSSYALSKA